TMMTPQLTRDGGLSPPYRLGRGARRFVWRQDHARLRDWAEAHPIKSRVCFLGQRALARAGQLLLGKAFWYRREAVARTRIDLQYTFCEVCTRCSAKDICDGFHGDYAAMFGTDEAQAITDVPRTEDPTAFIRRQEKVVEPEDESWAL
ncbi:MAG TPA: hypothetical protein HPP77_02660, partial [Candidatus Hydrogenedentes bacterium]|nr:hypothetical protein [Candidatus Hydrogenedentota bacterium]